MGLIAMLVVGVIAGLIARAIVPGNNSMGWIGTTVLGIVGSFVGGFVGSALNHGDGNYADFHPTGILGSVIGAVVVLAVVHLATGRRALRA